MKKTFLLFALSVFLPAVFLSFTSCTGPQPAAPQAPVPTATPNVPYITVPANSDTRIMDGVIADFNMGTCATLVVGYSSGYKARVLLNFDISAIPAASTVHSAYLTLSFTAATAATNISVYKVQKFWSEGINGCGGPAGAGASWNYADGAANTWLTAGGDYNAATQSQAAAVSGAVIVNITVNTAMVQDWVSNPAQNYGVLLKAADENAGYASVTGKTGGFYAPKLTVYYY